MTFEKRGADWELVESRVGADIGTANQKSDRNRSESRLGSVGKHILGIIGRESRLRTY